MTPDAGLFGLQDKRILITGGSSGIGRETARLVATLGARVCLVGRSTSELESVVSSLAGRGHTFLQLDLAEPKGILPAMEALASEGDGFSGLVHSAGIQVTRPLRMQSPEEVGRLFQVNCLAGIELTRAFRRPPFRKGPGSVVFVSSVMGIVGQPAVSGYCASKGAVIGFVRAAAIELAREGIRVNCVAPGHVDGDSRMSADLKSLLGEGFESLAKSHPLGLGRAADVANAIAFLLGDTARWITGSTLVVDGGYSAQ
jgi:NAD(P)-dependent dehydrogenase (short-subunit alcohol dehydrogenase family)